jgi:hypothetical protein
MARILVAQSKLSVVSKLQEAIAEVVEQFSAVDEAGLMDGATTLQEYPETGEEEEE